MSAQSKQKNAQTDSKGKSATTPAIILFGLDEYEKPKAAWFAQRDADLATKAAQQLQLNTLKITNAVPERPDRGIVGRPHAFGRRSAAARTPRHL